MNKKGHAAPLFPGSRVYPIRLLTKKDALTSPPFPRRSYACCLGTLHGTEALGRVFELLFFLFLSCSARMQRRTSNPKSALPCFAPKPQGIAFFIYSSADHPAISGASICCLLTVLSVRHCSASQCYNSGSGGKDGV